MAVRPPSADPGRQMRLLWRSTLTRSRQRGPKAALDIGLIVERAIAIADAEGVDGLTIRRLAGGLNVATMSIYTYVSGKAELLPLMLDAIHGTMARSRPSTMLWRDRLVAIAEDNLAMFEAHPWAATLSLGRPPLGPGTMAKYEYELQAFDGTGLSDPDMDSTLTFLLGFVASSAHGAWTHNQLQEESGISDEAWWDANAPFFELAFDPAKYPTAARVGASAGEALGAVYNADHAWRFGLARVLDGIASLIDGDAATRQRS